MYSIYKYNAGATQANILSDVIALLTGTTDVQTLSASCDKALTTVNASSTAAGWTVFDAAAGTNRKILRSSVYDNASQYKYMGIDTNATGYLKLFVYETFNATTHVGTNEATSEYYSGGGSSAASNSLMPRINTTVGGYLYISASARHCAIHCLQNGLFGSDYALAPTVVSEYTRWSPWDTTANGYPNFIYSVGNTSNIGGNSTGTGISAYCARYKRYDGVDNFGGNCQSYLGLPFVPRMDANINGGLGTVARLLDNNLNYIVPFFPIIATYPVNGFYGGNVTEQSDMWYIPSAAGNMNDEIVFNGNTYVIWQVAVNTTGSNAQGLVSGRIAVRKG